MHNDTCQAPGCDKPVHVKKCGLCQSHYNRQRYAGDLEVDNEPGSCGQCSAPIARTASSGPAPKYCSKACQYKASYERRKGGINERARRDTQARLTETVKACPNCGSQFTPRATGAQKFCSKSCGYNFHRDRSTRQCSEGECARPVRARGLCSMHYRRWARATGREKAPEWDDRRRANYHKRRALKKKLPAADIRPLDIYERDSWVCGLCGDGIDPDAAWPDPLSASLDHILPLSKGGHHVPENVQAAHLSCNVRKGNRVEADAMSA